ncbi:MAG: HAD family hydrolase [Anaerolineaceae bacterium]|nr:HAD family hydrolase [Anaerolineaceae bacterium]
MEIDIPGVGFLRLQNVVFDLNGTLAVDGKVSAPVRECIQNLSRKFHVVIASSDIHHSLAALAKDLGVEFHILTQGEIAPQKAALVRALGAEQTVAVGNGTNDWQMLQEAAVGIVIIGTEGASTKAVRAADLLVTSPMDAINCLLNPLRLTASLRH